MGSEHLKAGETFFESKPAIKSKPGKLQRMQHPMLQLQQAVGNQALIQMLRAKAIQAKLTVGQHNDAYEQEADQVADQVMRMPDPALQRQVPEEEEKLRTSPLAGTITPLIQRQAPEEEEKLQTSPLAGTITPLIQRQAPEKEEEKPLQAITNIATAAAKRKTDLEKSYQPVQPLIRLQSLVGNRSLVHMIQKKTLQMILSGGKPGAPHVDQPKGSEEVVELKTPIQSTGLTDKTGIPTLKAPLMISRDEKPEPTQETPTAFGSPEALPKFAWEQLKEIVDKFPERWKKAVVEAKRLNNGEYIDPELLHDQILLLLNLAYAGLYTEVSAYKLDYSKSLEMIEALSGQKDTYINLILNSVSLAIQLDLKKYLEGKQFEDALNANLGWAIIYGLLAQAGVVGIEAIMKDDLKFSGLIGALLKKYTEAPQGISRPYLLGNSPDPRWGGYPFWTSPSGLDLKLSGFGDETKPQTWSLSLGLNIASIADLYPEDEKEKAKYRGFEGFSYFSGNFSTGNVSPAPGTDSWLAGAFIGDHGVYTLLEGGYRPGSDGKLPETYFRSGLFFRALGPLSLQLTDELSYRPNETGLRNRLNAATTIMLVDNETWKLAVGGAFGGLVPKAESPGSWDVAGNVSLNSPGRFGVDLTSTYRRQDPFDPSSSRLFSTGGSTTLFNWAKVSAEYHQIHGGALDPNLPASDFRIMLLPGPNVTKWIMGLF